MISTRVSWTCQFCGTESITQAACPNCGANYITGRDPSEDPFFYYPKNRRFVTKQSTRVIGVPTHPGAVGCAVFICALAVVIFLLLILPSWRKHWELEQHSVLADGVVIDHRTYEGEDSTAYYVTYRFWVGSEERAYSREQVVNRSNYNRWYVESYVRVKYLPSDPSISRLVDDSKEKTNRTIGVVLGVTFMVIPALVIIPATWYRRRNLRLVRKGQVLPGVVVSCSGENDSDDDFRITLHYRFTTPDGRTITGKQRRTANELRRVPLPEPGRPVMVLYGSKNHYKLL